MRIDANILHSMGKMPDKFWYALSGKSATEKWMEQRAAMYAQITEREAAAAETQLPYTINVRSEIKIR